MTKKIFGILILVCLANINTYADENCRYAVFLGQLPGMQGDCEKQCYVTDALSGKSNWEWWPKDSTTYPIDRCASKTRYSALVNGYGEISACLQQSYVQLLDGPFVWISTPSWRLYTEVDVSNCILESKYEKSNGACRIKNLVPIAQPDPEIPNAYSDMMDQKWVYSQSSPVSNVLCDTAESHP